MLNRHIQRNGVNCFSFIILLSFLVYVMICIIVLFVLYTVYIALGRSMIELLTKVAEDTDSHQSPAIYLLLRGHDHGHFQAKTGSPVKRLIKYLNFILLLKYMDFSFNEYQFKDQKKVLLQVYGKSGIQFVDIPAFQLLNNVLFYCKYEDRLF